MSARTPIRRRASDRRPCPACGSGSKGCSVTDDGLHLCRGEPDGRRWRQMGGPDTAGFRPFREAGPEVAGNGKPSRHHHPSNGPPSTNGSGPTDWAAKAQRYAADLDADRRNGLLLDLGLPAGAFDGMTVGWNSAKNCYTFAESNAAGTVIGILERHLDGRKLFEKGGNRGLTVPSGWRAGADAIYLVEGPTDAAALRAAGLTAIGRPSNSGGVELLAALLRDVPAKRAIVVCGENDRKADGQWPGQEGATAVARKLADKLGRDILIAFPPAGSKDVRQWLTAPAQAGTVWPGRGVDLAEHLLTTASTVRPTPDLTDASADTEPATPALITAAEFAAADLRTDWLLPYLVAAGQPMVVGGRSKTLKTSVALDLAISAAGLTAPLGYFQPPLTRVRTAFLSAESGKPTLRETADRICAFKGHRLADLGDHLHFAFDMPLLTDAPKLTAFAAELADRGVRWLLLDPLYLGMGGTDMKNLFEAGAALRQVTDLMLARGVTVTLLHHAAGGKGQPGEPMTLADLSHAGCEQFARQWALLARATPWDGTGTHELFLTVGGSAGHGGQYLMVIGEGTVGEHGGRHWDVAVRPAVEVAREKRSEKAQKKQDEQDAAEAKVMAAVDAVVKAGQSGATKTSIREQTGYGFGRLTTILAGLMQRKLLRKVKVVTGTGKGAARTDEGYARPAGDHPDHPTDLLTGTAVG